MKKPLQLFSILLLTFICPVCYSQTSYGTGAGSMGGDSSSYYGIYAGSVSTGTLNTFVGGYSGYSNTSGYNNSGLGAYAMYSNMTGYANTAGGAYSLYRNRDGYNNVAYGYRTLYSNSNGSNNTACGYNALFKNENGNFNTAYGSGVLESSTMANYNTIIGAEASPKSTTAYGNSALGYKTLNSNTTGGYQVALGTFALYNNLSSSYNVAVGYACLYGNKTGASNTAIGLLSGYNNKVGAYNVFLGTYAGYNETGSQKLYIENSITTSPLIYGDFETNEVGINTSTTGYTLNVNGAISATSINVASDARLKDNTQEIENSLSIIHGLKGYTYSFKDNLALPEKNKKVDGAGAIQLEGGGFDVALEGNVHKNDGQRVLPEGKQYGVLAQEVKEVLPELVTEDGAGYMNVNYNGFVPILIEAIKELSDKYDEATRELQEENHLLKKELAEVKELIGHLSMEGSSNKDQIERRKDGVRVGLMQNFPNPFDKETTIRYVLPAKIDMAQIVVSNMKGHEVLIFDDLGKRNQVIIEGGKLDPGLYIYTLIIDGKEVDSKTLMLKK